jgi:N-acyl homoserine lactone hydrolase
MNALQLAHVSLLTLSFALPGCAVSSHETTKSSLGRAGSSEQLLAVIDQPGPLTVESVASADWKIDRSGLINLEHPTAQAAGLKDGDEPIQVYFHALRHPSRGLFVVDTGVEKALRDAPEDSAVSWLLQKGMHLDAMTFKAPLGDWLAAQREPLAGVFLTHIHLDHIMGMRDVPNATPIYSGPGETLPTSFMNMLVRGTTDDELDGKGALREWSFEADAAGRFAGVVDVFGDGSLWALWVPGHTPGSTAYLARTVDGPVLLTGDACHTRWGWEHDVEPGTFTADRPANAKALAQLRRLAKEHPTMQVRLGHQH